MNELINRYENEKKVIMMSVERIKTDEDTPWKLQIDSQEFKDLYDSIASNGILVPLLLRQQENDYIILSGNRRYIIACKLGALEVPVIIVEPANEYEINVIRNDSNLKGRKDILPSEKAFAYKKEIDAAHEYSKRPDLLESNQGQQPINTAISLADKYCMSKTTYYRYIQLVDLPQAILDAVDLNRISVSSAADYICKLNPHNMNLLAEYCKQKAKRVNKKPLINLLKAQELYGDMNAEVLIDTIEGKKKDTSTKGPSIRLSTEFIKKYVPEHLMTEDSQIEYIRLAIEYYKEHKGSIE